jgi:hypothetical protein
VPKGRDYPTPNPISPTDWVFYLAITHKTLSPPKLYDTRIGSGNLPNELRRAILFLWGLFLLFLSFKVLTRFSLFLFFCLNYA